MVPNIFNQERLALDHMRKLQGEAEHERRLAELPQQPISLMRRMVGKLGVLLVTLRSNLKKLEQHKEEEAMLAADAGELIHQ